MLNKILPMTGVEPWTSGIVRDRSTNWATTTSLDAIVNLLNIPLLMAAIGPNVSQMPVDYFKARHVN